MGPWLHRPHPLRSTRLRANLSRVGPDKLKPGRPARRLGRGSVEDVQQPPPPSQFSLPSIFAQMSQGGGGASQRQTQATAFSQSPPPTRIPPAPVAPAPQPEPPREKKPLFDVVSDDENEQPQPTRRGKVANFNVWDTTPNMPSNAGATRISAVGAAANAVGGVLIFWRPRHHANHETARASQI
jgi:hypothetical protein